MSLNQFICVIKDVKMIFQFKLLASCDLLLEFISHMSTFAPKI